MPLVSQTFDQLLDFTRTTSGTFVGSNGLVQTTPASVNLLPWTQQFDNAAWQKANTTITANTTVAPDGTSTADKLVETTSTSDHITQQNLTVSAAQYAYSVYIKAGERTWVMLNVYDGVLDHTVFFNLATGALGTQTNATGAITAVGNGWYRCTVISTLSAGTSFTSIRLATGNGVTVYTGDGTSGLFIWGAQLQTGSTATTYTRNNGGFYPPRFDYDPTTFAAKGLLIEEQRTNLLRYSEQLDNGAAWSNILGVTVTPNTSISPAGDLTADTVNFTATNGNRLEQSSGTAVNGETVTFSVYLRGSGSMAINVGTETGVGGGIEVVVNLTPTWTRYSATVTYSSPTGLRRVMIIWRAGNTATSVQAWGAQLETGAFATSYIPTVASQVTRTTDQCAIVAPNFAPWYNQSEGTFVFEGDTSSILEYPYAVLASDGSYDNRFGIYRALNLISGLVVSSSVLQLDISASPVVANVPFKVALAARTNSGNLSFNGGIGTDDTSITMPTVNQLTIGGFNGVSPLNGHIRSIRYYPTRLTNAQLQALTA